jgi:nitrogen-specific signal transduction histidine kinase
VVVPAHAVHEDVAARGGEPRVVAAADLADELPNVVSDVLRLQDGLAESPTMAAIARSLADTRQLLAAGQIARRVRHDLNNPLAAMLAEAQLLEMDAASTDDRDAAGRLLELCRRLVTIVGRLEGPASHSSG